MSDARVLYANFIIFIFFFLKKKKKKKIGVKLFNRFWLLFFFSSFSLGNMLLIMPTLTRWLCGPQKKMPCQSVDRVYLTRSPFLQNSSSFLWCELVGSKWLATVRNLLCNLVAGLSLASFFLLLPP